MNAQNEPLHPAAVYAANLYGALTEHMVYAAVPIRDVPARGALFARVLAERIHHQITTRPASRGELPHAALRHGAGLAGAVAESCGLDKTLLPTMVSVLVTPFSVTLETTAWGNGNGLQRSTAKVFQTSDPRG